jgi:DNA-binding transcriptional ArsR family regulator
MEQVPSQPPDQDGALPLLPDDIPVTMPDIPIRLTISSEQQLKAISDMARSRILGVIQYQPLTARQIARRLQATPGAIGHHLHVLEEAGLIKVVARRITRGIVASYYTRTARIFDFSLPPDVTGSAAAPDVTGKAHAELLDATHSYEDDPLSYSAFPHVRLSHARLLTYQKRFQSLINELIEEVPDQHGEVYGVFLGIFKSPPYMQVSSKVDGAAATEEGEDS